MPFARQTLRGLTVKTSVIYTAPTVGAVQIPSNLFRMAFCVRRR